MQEQDPLTWQSSVLTCGLRLNDAEHGCSADIAEDVTAAAVDAGASADRMAQAATQRQ